jgi:hypothetical protein
VSADVVMRADNVTWTVMGVYGPQENDEKEFFLDELKNLKARGKDEWLVMGDFNLIYKAEDKSNTRLNRRLMTLFKETLDFSQRMEIDLRGRAYTWSNEQNDPTFTRIDRVFGSPECTFYFLASISRPFLQWDPTMLLCSSPAMWLGKIILVSASRFFGSTCRASTKQFKVLGRNRSTRRTTSYACM